MKLKARIPNNELLQVERGDLYRVTALTSTRTGAIVELEQIGVRHVSAAVQMLKDTGNLDPGTENAILNAVSGRDED